MGNRLSKIATRTGDEGRTGLGDGSRVDKDSHRVEAFGDVDELNSVIGRLLIHDLPEEVRRSLALVQHELFDLGAELAVPGHQALPDASVERVDVELESFNDDLPALEEFILPGGGPPRPIVISPVRSAAGRNGVSLRSITTRRCARVRWPTSTGCRISCLCSVASSRATRTAKRSSGSRPAGVAEALF